MKRFLTGLLVVAAALPATQAVSICHRDNCLRQLLNGGNLTPWCGNYIGNYHPVITPVPTTITVTATRTAFIVHSSDSPPETITRKAAAYIAPNKRDFIPRAPEPAPITELKVRQASTLPWFASSCTGAPDRLSSACTCLIGSTMSPETVYWTKTQTTSTVTSNVCTATDVSQLRESWRGDWKNRAGLDIHDTQFAWADVQYCCTLCFHSWTCVGWYMRESDGTCMIRLLQNSSQSQPNDRSCSSGLIEFYDPEIGDFGGPFELGLCSYLTYSDE